MLKKSPSSEFKNCIGHFQDRYDDGTNIVLNNCMRNIVMKYESLVKNGQWAIESEKHIEILDLNIHIKELKILFA